MRKKKLYESYGSLPSNLQFPVDTRLGIGLNQFVSSVRGVLYGLNKLIFLEGDPYSELREQENYLNKKIEKLFDVADKYNSFNFVADYEENIRGNFESDFVRTAENVLGVISSNKSVLESDREVFPFEEGYHAFSRVYDLLEELMSNILAMINSGEVPIPENYNPFIASDMYMHLGDLDIEIELLVSKAYDYYP